MIKDSRELISESLYYNFSAEEISDFMGNLNSKLKDLVAKIIVFYIPQWREDSLKNMVALPRLQNIDWRIDIKTASDQIARMSAPSVIVQLQVEETLKKVDQKPGLRNINFELTKDALEVMMEGLQQIKKQLDSL
uniref:COMM domain-containing protein n=1 Tax=Arcella intermedia TaxID=1963864 RepID=A0A6B2LPW6_9EUKA